MDQRSTEKILIMRVCNIVNIHAVVFTSDLDFEQEDDGFTAGSTSRHPDVVVFADAWSKVPVSSFIDKAQKKAFMASHSIRFTIFD